MPFDIAASARPRTPVNKKKPRVDIAAGSWSSDFLAKKFADTDVESSMYRDAARGEPEETAAFRDRRSARDRMLGGNGLNVGRTGSGERVNPMMPGVPMGAVNENYGGIGDKSRWYTDMANFKHDPNTEQRQFGLLNEALTQRFNDVPGGVDENFMRPSGPPTVDNTSANRIQALKEIGGLKGAADAGLMDRFVSGSSLARGPNDTPERTLQLDKIAAVRQGEKQRKLDLRGNALDPTSIAGRMATRGAQKAFDRQQRMAGPSQEDMILRGAMNGNPAALRLADMMAQGNRERGIGQDRSRTALDIAKIENPQPTSRMQDQADAALYNDYISGGGTLPPNEWRQQFGSGGGGGVASGGPPALPMKYRDPKTGEAPDRETYIEQAKLDGTPQEEIDRVSQLLKPKRTWGQWFSEMLPDRMSGYREAFPGY